MTRTAKITAEILRSVLHYEPETGVFRWLVARGPRHVGDEAGTVTTQGYRQLTINTVTVRANRMAFLYMTGALPVGQVDHINGDRQSVAAVTDSRDIRGGRLDAYPIASC